MFSLQNVHVHLPDWTGGPDALWHIPGPGVEDGMCLSPIIYACMVYKCAWEVGLVTPSV